MIVSWDMRLFRRFGLLLGLLLAVTFHAYGQHEIIGIAEKTIIPLGIESTDSKAAGLARLAFDTHGGFRLVKPAQAQAVIKLTPEPGNKCIVQVITGEPAQTLFKARVTGKNPEHAIFLACDQAVKSLTGKPGYFAGEIAFVSDREGAPQIWVGDLFYRSVKPITIQRAQAQRPYLSPDGRYVFYRSYERRFADVYKYNLATGAQTVFADLRGNNAGGAVSPDGRWVAVTVSAPGNFELVLMDINNPKNRRRLTNNASIETDPCWSPDGRRLIVTSDKVYSKPNLFEIPAQGGPLTRLPTNISGYCAEATWNPLDESKIAFTANMGGTYQLALYEFGGGAAKPLTGGAKNAKEPVWLADGRHILFTEEIESRNHKRLAILDSITGKRTIITPDNFGNASQATYAY